MGKRPVDKAQSLVLLVHGTGASRPENEGVAWWQASSAFAGRFQQELGGEFDVQPAASVFHWSGTNDEFDRLEAAQDLLKHLQGLFPEYSRVHVVAHSHGGSVLLESLLLSLRNDDKLDHVASLTTVGTPFIRRQASPAGTALGVSVALGVVAAIVAYSPLRDVVRHWSELVHSGAAGSGLAVLILAATLLGYLVASSLGLLGYILARRRERLRLRALSRLWERFGQRWRSYYAVADEAINGLRIAGDLAVPVIPRSRQGLRSPIGTLAGHALWPLRVVYNGFLAPAADEFVAAALENQAFGGKTLGTYRYEVSAAPPLAPGLAYALGPDIGAELEERANAGLAQTSRQLREDLQLVAEKDPRLASLSETARQRLTFGELIHTGYFECSSYIALLADRIRNVPIWAPAATREATSRKAAAEQLTSGENTVIRRPLRRLRLSLLLTLARSTLVLAVTPLLLVIDGASIKTYTEEHNRRLASSEFPWVALLNYGPTSTQTPEPPAIRWSFGEEAGDPATCRPVAQAGKRGARRSSHQVDSSQFLTDWFFYLEQAGYHDVASRQIARSSNWVASFRGMLLSAASQRDETRFLELLGQMPPHYLSSPVREFEIEMGEFLLNQLITSDDGLDGVWVTDVLENYLKRIDPDTEIDLRPWLTAVLVRRGHWDLATKNQEKLSEKQKRMAIPTIWRKLISEGGYEEALAVLDTVDFTTSNTWAREFGALIEWRLRQGREGEAYELADRAVEATTAADKGRFGASLGWRWLACEFARVGLPTFVAKALEHVEDDASLFDFRQLGLNLIGSGHWDPNVILPRLEVYPPEQQQRIFSDLSQALAKAGRFADAESLVSRISDSDRAICLGRVMAFAASQANPTVALRLLPDYLEASFRSFRGHNADSAAQLEKFDAVYRDQRKKRGFLLSEAARVTDELAVHLVSSMSVREITAAAEDLGDMDYRIMILLQSVRPLLERERLEEAVMLLTRVVETASRERTYRDSLNRITALLRDNRPFGHFVNPGKTVTWGVESSGAVDELEHLEWVLAAGKRAGVVWPKSVPDSVSTLRAVRFGRDGRLKEAVAAFPSEGESSPARLRAAALLAFFNERAGEHETARALVSARKIPDRGLIDDDDDLAWPRELFEVGLREEAVRLLGDAVSSHAPQPGGPNSSDPIDVDIIRVIAAFKELAFQWLSEEPSRSHVLIVQTLLEDLPSTYKDRFLASLANLFLTKEMDSVAIALADSIGTGDLRATTHLLGAQVLVWPGSRGVLERELQKDTTTKGHVPTVAGYQAQLDLASDLRRVEAGPSSTEIQEAVRRLDRVVEETYQISDPELRSNLLLEVSRDFARIGWLHTAMSTSQDCLPGDRLRAALAVLASDGS